MLKNMQEFWGMFKNSTCEAELWACAETVYDVDDEAVRAGAQWQGAGRHQERHDVEEEGQVRRHVQGVVEGQHEEVAEEDRDVVPHQVLL